MKQSLIIVFCLFIFHSVSFAQSYVQKPSSEIAYLQPKDLKPNEKKGAYYNEHWTYHIILDNGAQIYLTYAVSHFAGIRGSASSGRLSLLNWEGEDYRVAREYSLNDLVFYEDTYKMTLNPERSLWFEGKPSDNNHRIFYRTGKDGILYDISINFDNPFLGFTQGDGIFKLGDDDELGMFTHIPFSNVSGFVALNHDTVKVTGIGFMNHVYETNIATRLFRSSYAFNQKTDKGFEGGFFMVPKDHPNEAVGYAYFYDGKNLTLKNPLNIVVLDRQEIKGQKIPSLISVNYEDGSNENFHFDEIEERISMLDELSGFKRMLVKRFLGGEILFYRGQAKIGNTDNRVFFNISLID